jgi:YfiH family protein
MADNTLKIFTDIYDGNLAYHVQDDIKNVNTNREKLALKYNYKNEDLIYMNQVHGNNVQVVSKDSPRLIDDCDGIITNETNLPLMVMVADCIPILLYDKKQKVIAALHAGRNSTFQKIVTIALEKMKKEFSCKGENIEAIMGPSIQKCCYEVSDELLKIVANSFGKEFISGKNIDLHGINKKLLEEFGVNDIKISLTCTKCSNKAYYSYRKDNKTGRFAGLIMLK